MASYSFLCLLLLLLFCCCSPSALSQQTYLGDPAASSSCSGKIGSGGDDDDDDDSSQGYTNNGLFPACSAFLTFRAAGPYRTPLSISQLFKKDSFSLGDGFVSETTVLETNRLVIVPINCSSASSTEEYYQMKVPSYIVKPGDSVFSVANEVYQGLTTCRALFDNNPTIVKDGNNITIGTDIVVPLRCACPTVTQSADEGIWSLITYVVVEGDTVADISARFGVDPELTFKANKLSKHDNSELHPRTTLLVPIKQRLLSMPQQQSLTTPSSKSMKTRGVSMGWLKGIILAAGGGTSVGIIIMLLLWCFNPNTLTETLKIYCCNCGGVQN